MNSIQKIESTEDSKGEQLQSSRFDHWRIFVMISASYCIIAFMGAIMLKLMSQDTVLVVAVTSILFAQSQLSAIFAALSPQSYFVRLLISQLSLAAVVFSFFGGTVVSLSWSTAVSDLPYVSAIFGIAASHAPQLVFGLLRIFSGWRLHHRDSARGPSYVLQDLFALMMFLAVSLSALTQLFKVYGNDGPESMFAFLFISLGLAIVTLVYGVPTFLSVFRTTNLENGLTVQIIVVFTLVFLIAIPLLAVGAPIDLVGMVGTLILGCCLATWLPLVILRENGFVLTRGKERNLPATKQTAAKREQQEVSNLPAEQ